MQIIVCFLSIYTCHVGLRIVSISCNTLLTGTLYQFRSSEDIDNDGSGKDFFPSDVIELVHELNPKESSSKSSSKRKFKPIFDRSEIKSFVEEEVETKVIRLMPSETEIKKLEAKLRYTC